MGQSAAGRAALASLRSTQVVAVDEHEGHEDPRMTGRERRDDRAGGKRRMTVGMVDLVAVDEHEGRKDPSLRSG